MRKSILLVGRQTWAWDIKQAMDPNHELAGTFDVIEANEVVCAQRVLRSNRHVYAVVVDTTHEAVAFAVRAMTQLVVPGSVLDRVLCYDVYHRGYDTSESGVELAGDLRKLWELIYDSLSNGYDPEDESTPYGYDPDDLTDTVSSIASR